MVHHRSHSFLVLVGQQKCIALGCFCLFFWFFTNCKNYDDGVTIAFKSNLDKESLGVLSNPEYWSSNPANWQITNHRIECVVSDHNTNLHLATRQLGTQNGKLDMKVQLGFFNTEVSPLNNNWAGFCIGAKPNTQYDSKYVQKNGLNVGVCTNGTLFIGSPSPNQKNSTIVKVLKKGLDLRVNISKNGEDYSVNFSVVEVESGTILGHISKKGIAPEQIAGNLVLVSNFKGDKDSDKKNTKSVWFKNWEIKGSKLKLKNSNTFNVSQGN